MSTPVAALSRVKPRVRRGRCPGWSHTLRRAHTQTDPKHTPAGKQPAHRDYLHQPHQAAHRPPEGGGARGGRSIRAASSRAGRRPLWPEWRLGLRRWSVNNCRGVTVGAAGGAPRRARHTWGAGRVVRGRAAGRHGH